MTKVGWIGLGKLGLTCAAVLADCGNEVHGYDPSPWAAGVLEGTLPLPHEEGLAEILARRPPLHLAPSPAEVVAASSVVFVAVQTPHAPEYGGETPAPVERRDFEYGFLVGAVRDVCQAAADLHKSITVVIVSTVLPGTCDRLVRPLLNEYTTLVYNPFFIAMGTTVRDFMQPEFVLLGADRPSDVWAVEDVYRSVHSAYRRVMSIPSAELTKVSYNTFISMKIVWANALMEVAEKTGADCDEIVDALELATDRVVSARYMRGGMGDGGHCHPRDLIAMSWLAERVELSYDLLGQMATAREDQSAWLAQVVGRWCDQTRLDPLILGKAYKPESPLTGGSPALLLAYQLGAAGRTVYGFDPYVDGSGSDPLHRPRVFVIGTKHPEFATYRWPVGSVVVDPWGYIPDQLGVIVHRLGRKRPLSAT